MDAARLNQIQTLFLAALDRPLEERTAFLDEACADDPGLRRQVENYLAADTDDGAFLLDEPLVRLPPDNLSEADLEDRRVGPYRLIRLLGRGGMGAVYLAERDDVERTVALKLVRGDLADPAARQRFLFERRVLGRLEHPGIARLYDVGVAEDGTPYFAMEVVDGEPVTDYCDRERLGIEERLQVFERIGRAVQHAHQHFVIHRDLKPSNVLVAEGPCGEPYVKLLDFGIAKLLAEADDETGVTTATGRRLLTPAYAAPEQVTGEAVSAATDVYSLGVMLYELLTGRRPYEVEANSARAVLTEEPSRPSTVVTSTDETDTATAEARRTTPDRLARRLRGDLDVICLKALQKEQERRYPSAEAFVEDIKRHLAGLPVTARPDSASYRLRKFAQRHRRGMSASAAGLLLLALVVAFYTFRLQAERDAAHAEAQRAEMLAASLLDLFRAADPRSEAGTPPAVGAILERAAKRAHEMGAQPLDQAQIYHQIGMAFYGMGRYDDAQRLMEEALAIRRTHHPRPHPETASILLDLGWEVLRRGDFEHAQTLFAEALSIFRETTPDAPGIIHSLHGLGLTSNGLALTSDQSDHAEVLLHEGERLLREALMLTRNHPDVSPRERANIVNDLGLVLHAQGDDRRAEAAFRRALDIRRVHLDPDDHAIARSLDMIGRFWQRAGDYPKAERFLREALAVRRRTFGDDHPLVSESREALVTLYDAWGKPERTAAYRDSIGK